jgi:aconitase A
MNKHNDGGPAFPRPASEYTGSGTCSDGNDPISEQEGMTMHQYFAGLAMNGFIARNEPIENFAYLAQSSLVVADAMIAEYERRAQQEKSKVAAALSPVAPTEFALRDAYVSAAWKFSTRPEATLYDVEQEFKSYIGTVEVATAPDLRDGKYEALVYDLAKMLGCDEREGAIKEAIYQSENFRKHGTAISR